MRLWLWDAIAKVPRMGECMSAGNERLSGMTCVIGGAASDIGRAVAKRLTSEGGIVVGIDAVVHGTGSISLTTDLANEDSVREVFARIHKETGRIDFLYNNAGLVTSEDKSVLETTSEVLERIWFANFRTAWLCCKHGIPYMLQNTPPSGSVVNCSSFLAGMGSATGQTSYNAAKAAVAQMSRDLGTHLARRGVRVNALCLGPIETPALTEVFARIGQEERRRRFLHMPLGRFGTLEEIAGTVAFLASKDSGFVTASVFPLDGGIQSAFTVPE